jgi:glycosyltransferase involved in cell wall biosynthesis
MRICLVTGPGAAQTGPRTYQSLVASELAVRHDITSRTDWPSSSEQFDVVHCLDIFWAARLKPTPKMLPAPLLVDIHDYYWMNTFRYAAPDLPLRWLRALQQRRSYRVWLDSADLLITHCNYVTEALRPRTATNVGIGVAAADPIPVTLWESRRQAVLFAGTNYFRKGIWTLARAWQYIVREEPAAQLVVAGYERPHTLFAARQLFRGTGVTFVGPQSRQQMADLYSSAKVYVLPSAIEASPVMPLEAAMYGTPSVCSAVGGIPEMIQDETSGLLVPPGNPERLATAILRCLTDARLANNLCRNARALQQTSHSPQRMIERLEAAYRSIAKE